LISAAVPPWPFAAVTFPKSGLSAMVPIKTGSAANRKRSHCRRLRLKDDNSAIGDLPVVNPLTSRWE